MRPNRILTFCMFTTLAAAACSQHAADDNVPGNNDQGGASTSIGAGGSDATSSSSASGSQEAVTVDNIIDRAAASVCSALTRCCDASSQTMYFEAYRDAEYLGEWMAKLPQDTTLDEESCLELMQGIYPDIWLGSWLERVKAGEVTFDAKAATTCLGQLDSATCGAEVQSALFDPTCFGNAAPYGGEEKRKMFDRTHVAGQPCQGIRDGFGGLYFGSCSPTEAFCCIPDPSLDGGCNPFPGLGKAGTCKPVSATGETCAQLPLQLCASGLECDAKGVCGKVTYTPLSNGETCMEGFNNLGACTNGYCDIESKLCTPKKNNTETCTYGFECDSGWCDQDGKSCIDNPTCAQ